MKRFLVFALIALHLPSVAVAAIQENHRRQLSDALDLYRKGAYAQALQRLKDVKSEDRETQASVAFFEAISHFKLQEFKDANARFAQALLLGDRTESLHYDYGQSLFASQKLGEAEQQFRKSITKGYKVAASAYYVGYINQILEKNAVARDFYGRIQKLRSDPDKVKQAALFQMAEMQLAEDSEIADSARKRAALKANSLPAFERARNSDSSSPVAAQAEAKIEQIEAQLRANAKMRNGMPIPGKLYTAKVTQDVEYDSNVVARADGAVTQVTSKDAVILRWTFFGRYQWNWKETWSFIPEFNTNYTRHLEQQRADIYQNDAWNNTLALRTRWEHWALKRPGTGLYEVEYNYLKKDYLKQHQLPYYSSYLNFVVGERVNVLQTGSSTLKLNLKLADNVDSTRSGYTPGVTLTQLVGLWNDLSWVNTLGFEWFQARSKNNDEKNYKYATSVTLPEIWQKITVTPSFSLNVKDTVNQKNTRGWEQTLTPAVNLNRRVLSAGTVDLDYTLTRNRSKDKTNYQYKKHQLKLGLSWSF